MSDYTKITDFAAKDALAPGNPAKIITGTAHDDEYNAIATAIATKANIASPTFTGTATFANANATGPISATGGQLYSYGLGGNNNRGAFYGNSTGLQYIQNINDTWNVTGSWQAAGLIYGNGGGSGLGSITVSTSAPSGGSNGDLWLQY